MRKVILLLLLVFCMAIPDIQAAVKVSIDKLKYEIDTEAHTATVTGLAKYEETYDLVIPDFIDYNNEQIPVTAIGNSAFNLFSNRLKGSLTIGDNVTTIGDFAFGNCSGFTGSLTIGDNVTTIGEWAFGGCSGFTGSLTIGDNVTTIGEHAFYGCSGFTGTLTLGDNVTTIGDNAFRGCSGFTGSLTIPDNVITIGQEAFKGCKGFTGTLTIGNNVTTIGIRAFEYCSGFTGNLTIGDNVTTIGDHAFHDCKGFTGSLRIGDNVTTIGSGAFQSCIGFTGSLTIGDNVTTIGNDAFQSCYGFTGNLTIGNNVTTIGIRAFEYCGFTGNLTIGDNVTTIGDHAFHDCKGFTGSLRIGDNVTTIGHGAFDHCSGFTGSLTIGDNVTIIEHSAFWGCSGFTGTLTIPQNVTTIGDYAFQYCSGFTGSLTIGGNVTTIGRLAFATCDGIESVTCYAIQPPENDHYGAFSYETYKKPLYVPSGSVNSYKVANDWKNFQYINPVPVHATSVSLNKTEITLLIGESHTLIASILPEGATDEVVWTSDKPEIATVSEDGIVTGIAVGTATITATCGEASATCTVTVNPIVAETVTLNVEDLTLLIGASEKLTATVTPDNTTDKTVVWTSDKPEIATVSEDGTVTGVSVGTTTITATCGEASATCTVTVNPIVAESVSLNVEDITLLIGVSEKLTATVTPDNTTDKTVVWTSDKPEIATVSEDGTVTGVSVGTATITATCGEATATCIVTVNPIMASNINLNVEDMTLLIGASEKLTATVTPDNTTNKKITWTSDKPEIATVSEDGTVTAIAVGTTTITATCGEVSATCTVTVNPVVASNINLNVQDMTLLIGASEKLTATVTPDNTTDKKVTWKSDKPEIATVSEDGTVTAIAVGTTTITATCGEVSATCTITVNPIVAENVTLNVEDMTMLIGASEKLTATVTPDNTTDKKVTWKSDKPEIATVSEDGTVTAIAVGTATITATCGEVSATCTVTVNPIVAESVTLNVEDLTLLIGASEKLTATVTPDNTTDKTVVWTSDKPEIATVSVDGTVTGVSVGTTLITATCGEASATCTVTVNPIVASNINLNVEDMTLLIGASEKLTATVTPDNTTDKTVVWTSDKPEIATVSEDGTVTGVAVGTATITATCGEASATCTVTVNPIVAETVTLNVEDLTLLIGASEQLTATVTPDNTTDKKITWTSDKPEIATVSEDGTVTGVSVGTALITATCGEASATCAVTVNPIVASNINLNVEDMTLLIGASEKLTATVTPDNTTDKTVVWTSDKPEIATVSEDGTVTGVAVGTATITATCGEASATCTVTVNPIVAETVTLNVEDLTLLIGASEKLTATVTPDNTTDKTVVWTSDKPEIATVSVDGTVTGVSVGTTTITATCGEVSATCTVTVNPIVAESVTLNVEDLTLLIGASEKLTATVTPENTTDKTVVWTSDKPEIATVSEDGTVTGVAVGTATITATCGEVSATCTVTVNPIVAETVTLNVEDLTLLIGASEKLTATVTPDNTTEKTVVWTSDKPEIATVSEDGTVTGVAVGTATITATCGEASATCTVTVNPIVAESVTINVEDMTLLIGASEKLTATVTPDNTTDKKVTWTSDKPEIATVSEDGIVTGVAVGKALITVTCGEARATCTVTVNPIVAESVTLNVEDLTLLIGASEKLTATVTPNDTTDKTVVWTSDKPEIATVSVDGTVTGVSVGTTTITATCGEVSATCTVTVYPIVAESVTLNVEDLTLLIGASEKLTATVTPENTTDKTVVWTSDKPEIATVSEDGTVSAITVGKALITATCGEVSATCTVTVNPIVAETVTLNVEDLTLLIGASEQLTATVSPDDTTDKTVVWTSDKPEIATVSEDGTVTGIAVGTATITATCGEVSANCTVTVNSPVIEPTAIILSAENLWILKGRKESVTAQVLPADTTDPEIIWSTADPSIASIDQSGIVTAISAGVTNIYATCGEITATCTVTVGDRPDAPTKMERKGNGASRTFVILMPLNDDELAEKGYDFVYGYTDAKGDDHVFASTPLRYSHTTSEIYNNPDNDFWVFAVVANEDGENVVSVRCHLDGSEDDDFDAASLIEAGNSTRSKNYENWIIPTPHGARISIRSCGETSIAAYTLDGNRIFNENYGAGVDVDAHLTDEILPPSTYIIVAVSGDYISTKKIIIR